MIELNLQLTKEDVEEIKSLTENPPDDGVIFEKESAYVGKYAACFTLFNTPRSGLYSTIGLSYDLGGNEGSETTDIEDYSVDEGSKTVFLKDYDNEQCVVAKIDIII